MASQTAIVQWGEAMAMDQVSGSIKPRFEKYFAPRNTLASFGSRCLNKMHKAHTHKQTIVWWYGKYETETHRHVYISVPDSLSDSLVFPWSV